MRLRTSAAVLLMVTASGLVSLPASAADDAKAKPDAAVAIPATTGLATDLTDRLQSTLPGASEAQAAQVTAETATLAKKAISDRAAAAKRASRARAARIVKAQLRMAIPAYGHISASFGSRGRWATRHTGMDINARYGDTVRNVISGTVIKTAYDRSYGRIVVVRGHGVDIWYAHLSRDYVRVGQSSRPDSASAKSVARDTARGPICILRSARTTCRRIRPPSSGEVIGVNPVIRRLGRAIESPHSARSDAESRRP